MMPWIWSKNNAGTRLSLLTRTPQGLLVLVHTPLWRSGCHVRTSVNSVALPQPWLWWPWLHKRFTARAAAWDVSRTLHQLYSFPGSLILVPNSKWESSTLVFVTEASAKSPCSSQEVLSTQTSPNPGTKGVGWTRLRKASATRWQRGQRTGYRKEVTRACRARDTGQDCLLRAGTWVPAVVVSFCFLNCIEVQLTYINCIVLIVLY